MSMIEILLFFHLIGAFLIGAGTILGEVVFAAMRRTRNTRALLALVNVSTRVPMLMITGAVIALVFGSALVKRDGYSFSEPWIGAAYLGWILAVLAAGVVLRPAERKLRTLAEAEVAAGRTESAALDAAIADPKASASIHFVSAMLIVFIALMVFKPGH